METVSVDRGRVGWPLGLEQARWLRKHEVCQVAQGLSLQDLGGSACQFAKQRWYFYPKLTDAVTSEGQEQDRKQNPPRWKSPQAPVLHDGHAQCLPPPPCSLLGFARNAERWAALESVWLFEHAGPLTLQMPHVSRVPGSVQAFAYSQWLSSAGTVHPFHGRES